MDGETRAALRKMGFCLVPTQDGKADLEWIPLAGQHDWTVITADQNIMNRPEEKQAVIDNEVKLFILHPQPQTPWDALRVFVAMWSKVRREARWPGSGVWKIGDDTAPSRWQQLLPEPASYTHIDFTRTPAGHLLNLFAEIVTLHDEGWFSWEYVNSLHDAILDELERRHRGLPPPPAPEPTNRKKLLDTTITLGDPDSVSSGDFDDSVNPSEFKLFTFDITTSSGFNYPMIVPARQVSVMSLDTPTKYDPNRTYLFAYGNRGFRRSGLGLNPPPLDQVRC